MNNTSIISSNHNSKQNKNYTRIFELISRLDYYKGDKESIKEVINLMRKETFNIKGYFTAITQAMSPNNNNQYEIELMIRSGDKVFSIIFKKASEAFSMQLKQLPLNCLLYFNNIQAYLVLNQLKDEIDYTLKFIYYAKSRMFYPKLLKDEVNMDNRDDNDNDIGNSNEDEFDCDDEFDTDNIIEPKEEDAIKDEIIQTSTTLIPKIAKKTITAPVTATATATSTPMNNAYNNNNSNCNNINAFRINLVDISTSKCTSRSMSNISYCISHNTISNHNNIISIQDPKLQLEIDKIDHQYKDFSPLLTKQMQSPNYPINTIDKTLASIHQSSQAVYVTVCGIVSQVKYDIKFTSIILLSLIDSNTIKIIHYPNNWLFRPQIKQVILIKNIRIKLNRNLEIILENPQKANVLTLGLLSNEEYDSYNKLRIQPNMLFSSIITLLNNTIIRSLQKYLITIKSLIKLTARIEKGSQCDYFNGFPSLELFCKCIVDDGSYEAELNLYNKDIETVFKFTFDEFNQIYSIANKCNNCVLYHNIVYNTMQFISKETIQSILHKHFIVYGVSGSKIACKHFNDYHLDNYLLDLGQRHHFEKNIVKNLSFINGDILFEKNSNGEMKYLNKPLIKASYIEEVYYDNDDNNYL